MLGNKLLKQISKNTQKHIEKELTYGCNNSSSLPVFLKKGQGIHLWDVDGKKYIDCNTGSSALNQGHCHPKILEAMTTQAQKLTLTSRAFGNELLGDWMEKLTKTFGFDKVVFCNGGVEASEGAVKFARRWGYEVKGIEDDKARVLFANKNFWGRSLAACASSNDPVLYEKFGPLDLGFDLIDFNNTDQLENALKNNPNYAAFMIEPIQGAGGIIVPDFGYLKRCREICDKYNVLLIFDEIQTGCGRTGQLLDCHWEGVQPDIISLGKSLSGGFYPISATLASNEVMDLIR